MMSVRAATKALVDRVLSAGLVRRGLRAHFGGIATVFVLHRVVPDCERSKLALNRSLEVTPEQLEEVIHWVRDQGYRIAAPDELADRLDRPDPRAQRLCVFTFDDGYRDNLSRALPVFERMEAPMSIFVTTDFPDRRMSLWWYALEHIVVGAESVSITLGDQTLKYSTTTTPEKNYAFDSIRARLMSLSNEALRAAMASLGADEKSLSALVEKVALSWDEVRRLAQHPLVTIGAHAVTHRRLSALSGDDLLAEVLGSKRRIEAETGLPVHYFCYPFGDPGSAGSREFAAAEAAQFRGAFTTRIGNVIARHAEHRMAMPRIPVDGGAFSRGSLNYMMSGAHALRQRRLSNLVVQ